MANEVSAVTDVTTEAALLTGETYTKTATTITGSVAKNAAGIQYFGLEIVNASNVVIRRKQGLGDDFALNAQMTVTITGLVASTLYRCRMYRGDTSLADI